MLRYNFKEFRYVSNQMTEVLNTKPFPGGEGNFKKISHGESAASFSKPPSLPSADMTLKIQSVIMPDTPFDFLVQNIPVTSTATNLSHRITSIMAAFN